ncbi:ABC transporter permease [Xanthobacter autotrophicus]|uniref:ABC transporter permease n=1 Tax=Xanthobacter autotrophicus TaxID=280 RepID=UPI0037282A6A
MAADVAVAATPATSAARPRKTLRALVRRASVIGAGTVLALTVGAALFAPWIAPYDPNAINLGHALNAPSAAHWFGTDQLGRDVLSRVIFGGRMSLFIAACVVTLAGLGGTLAGIMAGYRGGWVDNVVMRFAEIQYALPPVILALVLVSVLGPSTTNIILVITLANWARFARVIRAEAISLRHRDFVLLARLSGASPWRIVLTHILPNVRATLIVLLTLDIGLIIILEATLSFLGLGIQPPDPSWGTMIAEGRGYLERAWWTSLLPGAALLLTVLAANIIGDSLGDRRGAPEGEA